MKELDQKAWREQLVKDTNAIIIDTRTPEECATGIVANAMLIDFLKPAVFLEKVAKLDKQKNYYIYCRSGNRSGKACKIMNDLGFQHTINLTGGMNTWNGETVIP